METTRKRSPRLGRGLSSLMGRPVKVGTAPMKPLEIGAEPTTTAERLPTREMAGGGTQTESRLSWESDKSGSANLPKQTTEEDATELDSLWYLPIGSIKPNPHQPRQNLSQSGIRKLAESIKSDGLMQPIVVRPARVEKGGEPVEADGVDGGSEMAGSREFELVAGERRWRAAQLAGLLQIPAIVRVLNDQQLAEWSLIENLQREDLNPIDRAEAFRRLSNQFKLSHDQIASRIGLERSTVSNLLRLLELPENVKALVRENLLSMGQARAVSSLSDLEQQKLLAGRAVREGMSVREVEVQARRLTSQVGTATAESTVQRVGRPAHLEDLERQISHQLGTKVSIQPSRKKGAGRLMINFYSLEEFDGLLSRLGVETD